MFKLIHGQNIGVRLPKDQRRSLEKEPCNLGQHYLAVCIDKKIDDPYVDWFGVDATIFPHIDIWMNPLACTDSDLDNGVQDGGGLFVDSQIAHRRGSVCEGPKFLHVFKSIYLIN